MKFYTKAKISGEVLLLAKGLPDIYREMRTLQTKRKPILVFMITECDILPHSIKKLHDVLLRRPYSSDLGQSECHLLKSLEELFQSKTVY